MNRKLISVVTVLAICIGATVQAGTITFHALGKTTADADAPISTAVTYTHKLDFGGEEGSDPSFGQDRIATVNGVTFDPVYSNDQITFGNVANDNFDVTMPGIQPVTLAEIYPLYSPGDRLDPANANYADQLAGDILRMEAAGPADDQAIYDLFWDFIYNPKPAMILEGLTPGEDYILRIYIMDRSDPEAGPNTNNRIGDLHFDVGNDGTNEDSLIQIVIDNPALAPISLGERVPFYLQYNYTADSTGLLAIKEENFGGTSGWDHPHYYGLTNEVDDGTGVNEWALYN